jgi:Cys-tRNA(Pro)/Cys-tRNA(Cys) deacylase
MSKKEKDSKSDMKTNVMRVLDQAHVEYKSHCYADTEAISGVDVAAALNENPKQCFKTLVTVAKSGEHYVYMLPVDCELDLKKAANAAHEKAVEMIKSKELLPLTGYIHGGCSPIGMKKKFKTFVHSTCVDFDTIMFSAGKIGYQVELSPEDLKKVVDYQVADIVV